jgi:DNA-binding transcriptional MerR regulator
MGLLSIGEFARRSRLSARALRRYDELGLLPPTRVDTGTGYRWYHPAQVDTARLVAALRQVGVPLAQIRPLLGLDPAAAAARLSAWWAGAEAEHAARRDLARFLVSRLNGEESVMYEVAIREVPERSLLCLKRNVDEAGAWDLGKEFVAIMRARPLPRLPGRDGATFAIYHGEVSEDSDGPVEWCRPVPAGQARALAADYPELTLRTEPAHGEAYIHLGNTQATPPRWHLIAETLTAWAARQDRERADLGSRVTYLATPPVTADSAPDCDYAVPLS